MRMEEVRPAKSSAHIEGTGLALRFPATPIFHRRASKENPPAKDDGLTLAEVLCCQAFELNPREPNFFATWRPRHLPNLGYVPSRTTREPRLPRTRASGEVDEF
jgi:hypothetical protein